MHPLTVYCIKALAQHCHEFSEPSWLYKTFGYHDLKNWMKILELYELLGDEVSRETLKRIIRWRIMAGILPEGRVDELFPIISSADWAELERRAEQFPAIEGDSLFDRLETWILKGYEHEQCQVETGETVFDIGAFTGNTGRYFAEKTGTKGKVYCFEPHPRFFALLQKNVRDCPQVECVQAGCAAKDGEAMLIDASTSSVLSEKGVLPVVIRSVDSFVAEHGISKVDYIKMDIEGLEPESLDGARETIRRFHPKLAVCVYHKPDHLHSLLEKIRSFGLPYSYHLKHSSRLTTETVLFAQPQYKDARHAARERERERERAGCQGGRRRSHGCHRRTFAAKSNRCHAVSPTFRLGMLCPAHQTFSCLYRVAKDIQDVQTAIPQPERIRHDRPHFRRHTLP